MCYGILGLGHVSHYSRAKASVMVILGIGPRVF